MATTKGLGVIMELLTERALQDADKFVQQLKTKLAKVDVKLDVSGSGTSGLKSKVEKEAKGAEEAAKAHADRSTKAAEKLLQDLKLIETRKGLAIKEEQQKFHDLAEQMQKSANAQELSNLKVHARQLQAEYSKALDMQRNQKFVSPKQEASGPDISPRMRQQEAAMIASMNRMQLYAARNGMDITQITNQWTSQVSAIVAQRSNMTAQQFIQALRLEEAAYKQFLRDMQAMGQNQPVANTGISNKTIQQMFQLQQMVEDFSFAGFRGASNNIAMLANTMGGAGGLAVMAGLAATALVPLIANIGQASTMAETSRRNFDSMGTSIDAMLSNIQALAQIQFGDQTASGVSALAGKIKSTRAEVNGLVRQYESLVPLAGKFQELQDIGSRYGSMYGRAIADTRNYAWATERALKIKQELNAAMETRGQVAPFTIDRTNPFADMDKVEELAKKYGDQLSSINGKVAEHTEFLKQARAQLEGMAQNVQNIKSANDIAIEYAGTAREKEELRHRKAMEGMNAELDARRELGMSLEPVIQKIQQEMDLHNKNTAAIKEQEKAMKDLKKTHAEMRNDLIEAAEKYQKEVLRDDIDGQREKLQLLKQQNSELKQQAQEHENNVKRLDKERDRWSDKAFDKGMDAKSINEEKALKKRQELEKQMLDQQLSLPFGGKSLPSWFKKGKTDQLEAMHDAQLDQLRQRQVQAQQDALAKRAKVVGGSGDFEHQRDILKEQQDRLFTAAGQTENQQLSNKYLAEAEKLNKEIEASYNRQIESERVSAEEKRNQMEQTKIDVNTIEEHIKKLEQASRNVPQVDPVSLQALEKARELLSTMQQISVEAANQQMIEALSGGTGGISSLFGGAIGGFRATGGPVNANTPYVVGENGAELIIPNSSGFVVNNRNFSDAYAQAMGSAYFETSSSISNRSYSTSTVRNDMRIGNINYMPQGKSLDLNELSSAARRQAANLRLRQR